MRPQGRATIDARNPDALGVCDRCYFRYNLKNLRWQFQWVGPKIQNIRILVCDSCYDEPQQQLRTIILPPDPVSVINARPDNNVSNDNPMSGIGASPNWQLQQYGSIIGNLLGGGGIAAAFDANPLKPSWQSANNAVSNSSYNNYVGINWTGNVANLNMPSSLKPPVIRHSLISYEITAPTDRSFVGNTAANYLIQGSHTDTPVYGAWTTISSGTTGGINGEVISGYCTGAQYQCHRVAFQGDQLNQVAVAQVQFNVAQVGTIATAGSS